MDNTLFGIFLTLSAYLLITLIQRKTKIVLINPLLFSSILIIIFLLVFNIDYSTYESGTKFISFLIKPATVSLAIPLYQNLMFLKKHYKKILITTFSGVIIHASLIALFSYIFKFDSELIGSFIPKSLTTAVAISVSNNLGGIPNLTIAIVILTGIFGALISDSVFKLFKVNCPVSKGLSLGIASHALGTSKASSYGNLEASMATLSLILTSIITLLLSPLIFKIINLIV